MEEEIKVPSSIYQQDRIRLATLQARVNKLEHVEKQLEETRTQAQVLQAQKNVLATCFFALCLVKLFKR